MYNVKILWGTIALNALCFIIRELSFKLLVIKYTKPQNTKQNISMPPEMMNITLFGCILLDKRVYAHDECGGRLYCVILIL
jgi:hypothetical protein